MSEPVDILKVRRRAIKGELALSEERLLKAKDEVQMLKDRVAALKAAEAEFDQAVATLSAAAAIGG